MKKNFVLFVFGLLIFCISCQKEAVVLDDAKIEFRALPSDEPCFSPGTYENSLDCAVALINCHYFGTYAVAPPSNKCTHHTAQIPDEGIDWAYMCRREDAVETVVEIIDAFLSSFEGDCPDGYYDYSPAYFSIVFPSPNSPGVALYMDYFCCPLDKPSDEVTE